MNVGINGFGRVGKQILKVILNNYPEINVVQINDLADLKVLSFLFKHDSVYGNYKEEVTFSENFLKIGDKQIKVTNERDLDKLEWDPSIDVV
ncbi:MAG: type I glyceraldehyde-3-phosphate dehydrogenase, partial [Caldisericia bacterium]|nr:type I glyceraldehyde-3-phosphate dehydrogenase [Caldisericia bacterium]